MRYCYKDKPTKKLKRRTDIIRALTFPMGFNLIGKAIDNAEKKHCKFKQKG